MNKLIIVLFSVILAGCKTPQMYVAPELKSDSEILAVKGRQGFQIGRSLHFGRYSTSKVKQGWVKGYDIPFFVRFQGMKEKLSFRQLGKPGQVADVYSVGKFRSTELPLLKDYFNIILKENNHFAGTVVMNDGHDVWEFLLFNPDGEPLRETKAGFIKKNSEIIDVNGIRKLENGKNSLATQFWGYEFIYNGEVVGAVETTNSGNVRLKNNLPDDLKLVLASLSSCLLLRTNLEEKVE